MASGTGDDSWLLRGVAAPLGLIVLAVVILLRPGLQGSPGPLSPDDSAVLATGIWGLAPAVGGLLTRNTSPSTRARSARTLGVVLGAVIAFLVFFTPRANASWCGTGQGLDPVFSIGGSLTVVAGVGVGTFLSSWLASVLGHRALLLGLAVGWAIGWLSIALPMWFFFNVLICT